MSAACGGCGAALKKPGRTGLCLTCFVRQPKSAETRERMRAAATLRESDLTFRERRQAAARAGVAASMADPCERERRSDWGRQLGRRYGVENAALLGVAGSDRRMAIGRKVSAARLSDIPLEYRAAYRHLNKVQGLPSSEARRVIQAQVEADARTFARTGRLPQSERAGR